MQDVKPLAEFRGQPVGGAKIVRAIEAGTDPERPDLVVKGGSRGMLVGIEGIEFERCIEIQLPGSNLGM